MRAAILLLALVSPPIAVGAQEAGSGAKEASPPQAPLARAALEWVDGFRGATFDVLQDDAVVGRVQLDARVELRGERRCLTLELEVFRPPGADVGERHVARLALDAGLTPIDARWWAAQEERPVRAKLALEGHKLTGQVGRAGVVRNVPPPVVTEASLLLRAALLPREQGAAVTFARLELDARDTLHVELDERLAYAGREEREGATLAVVEHREPRGRPRARLLFDGPTLVAARWGGGVEWRPIPDDERP